MKDLIEILNKYKDNMIDYFDIQINVITKK